METMFAQGYAAELTRPIFEVADVILANAGEMVPDGARPPSRIGLFVLTRAVEGVVRAAIYDGADFVSTAEFEDEGRPVPGVRSFVRKWRSLRSTDIVPLQWLGERLDNLAS
jgi:hypothetical protein